MKTSPRTVVLATLLCAAALSGARGQPASAAAPGDSPAEVQRAAAAPDPREVQLGLAGMERRRGNLRGVVEALEPLDFSTPSFAGADRAAFLLTQAYRQLGDRARLEALAAVVGSWNVRTTYTRLIAFERGFGDHALPRLAGDPEDATDTTLIGRYASALSGKGSAGEQLARWTALAAADTATDLGRDLAGAALVHLSVLALANGEGAASWLERVPPGSRYHARAQHLRGLDALERGDFDRGAELLAEVMADPAYGARREVLLALAGAAMDRGDWGGARARYEQADAEWAGQRDAVRALRVAASFADVWASWQASPDSAATLVIDAGAGSSLATRYADASADLVATWNEITPSPGVPPRAPAPAQRVLPPSAGEWSELARSSRALAAVRSELERSRWAAGRAAESLADRGRYLELGRTQASGRAADLTAALARIASLRATTDSTILEMRWPREANARRLAWRLERILRESRSQADWLAGMRQLYVCGPDSARQRGPGAGEPGPAAALDAERSLNAKVRAEAGRWLDSVTTAPAPQAGQSRDVRFADLLEEQAGEAARQLRQARGLAASLAVQLAEARADGALASARARVARLGRIADSLALADDALRARIALSAVERTLAALEHEREGIDYGLAASSYALAVQLGARDSVVAPAALVARGEGAPARGPWPSNETQDFAREPQEAARWRALAMPELRKFLATHPNSAARGEIRFRLADLELVAARQEFREKMAAFLAAGTAGARARSALPELDAGSAIRLYLRMLAEDPGFPRIDVVRYSVGALLADASDRGAGRYFRDLVTLNPGSAYEQEAWLRLGDLAFNGRQFPESVPLYTSAAGGSDPTLCAMASYKLGWAEFNQDHFLAAADAFRAVLDLYEERRAQLGVDVETEAEEYLVNSLAAAGGAAAFAAYFDRAGPRPYEGRSLVAMGDLYRRYGRLGDLVAVNELVLTRMAEQPEALEAARQLIETHEQLGRGELASEERMAYAVRFAPGGAWYEAQQGDSLRVAGAAFAREAYLDEVAAHRERALADNSREEWRKTRRAFESLLERWPGDPEAARFHLGAGEASLKLADYPAAMQHFELAERSSPDTSAAHAGLLRVAAADAWYESSRFGAGTGRDSLARTVLGAADEFLSRHPGHERGADIVWRQSQLSLAHRWDERAVDDLGRMVAQHPGDRRSPLAGNELGEACFRLGRFADAGAAFERAMAIATAQGRDSLARRARSALPVCAFRVAEAAVASDSTQHARNAALYEQVALCWPGSELAPRALYRAAIGYARAQRDSDAVRVLQALVRDDPEYEYVNEARLRLAQTLEGMGETARAALAYLEFSTKTVRGETAAAAWLKSADLFAAAGQAARADDLRLEYIRRYPNDAETKMEIMEALARRDLALAGPGHPVSALLARREGEGHGAAPASFLSAYLMLSQVHPALASRELLARVRFAQGEEAGETFAAAILTQPITRSIPAKKLMLDTLLICYRRCADLGVPELAHASAFRMGQALQDFATALEHSDPPLDLAGDDLRAYQGVLAERARAFASRGQEVWTELLRSQGADGTSDAWLDQARSALWQRFAWRFLFRPEVQFPLVEPEDKGRGGVDFGKDGASADAHPPVQGEEAPR